MRTVAFVMLAYLMFIACPSHGQSGSEGYRIIDSVLLGGEGGWDYLTVDTTAERVYVSRGMRVQVVDLEKLSIIGEISPTPGVHGIALAPEAGYGYISNGRDSSVTVFVMATLKTLATIRLNARNPDAILFEPTSKRVFTFNGGSANATAIETPANTIAGTVPLGGKPEFAVADGRGHVFVNIEDKSTLTEFDARSLRVIHTWSLSPGEEPSGLAIDREHHCLFAVCRNRTMVVLDTESGKIITTVPIGAGVDGAAYDAARGLAFSSNGEGTITVVRRSPQEKYTVAETVVTRRGARTLALDEKTHRIYTVSARFGPTPAATPEHPRPRPTMEVGSATLYVLGR